MIVVSSAVKACSLCLGAAAGLLTSCIRRMLCFVFALRSVALTSSIPSRRFSLWLRLPSLRQCCRGPSISTFTGRWTLLAVTTCDPVQAPHDKMEEQQENWVYTVVFFFFSFPVTTVRWHCCDCTTTTNTLCPWSCHYVLGLEIY